MLAQSFLVKQPFQGSALGKGAAPLGPAQRIAVAFAKRGQAHDGPAFGLRRVQNPSAQVILVPGRQNEQLLAVLLDARAEFVDVPLPDLLALDLALGLLAALDRVVDDGELGGVAGHAGADAHCQHAAAAQQLPLAGRMAVRGEAEAVAGDGDAPDLAGQLVDVGLVVGG